MSPLMRRLLLVLLLWLVAACAAVAATPPSVGWFFDNWKTNREMGPYGSVAAACSAMVALNNDSSACISSSLLESVQQSSTSGQCKWQNYINGQKAGDPAYGAVRAKRSCPSNAAVDANGMCPDQPDQCKAKAGTSEIVNVTSGWARDSSLTTPAQSWVYTYKLPSAGTASMCSSDGCEQSIDASEPCSECQAYTSLVPGVNGLYRKSVDFRGHYSGSSCDPSKVDIDRDLTTANDARDPPCPGYVGEVNGKKGCYGTAEKPVPASPPRVPTTSEDNGNPAAGAKPSSGEGSGSGGSGRTPSAGAGGSAGGPAAASGSGGGGGSSTRPDGTTNKPSDGKEQQACGAPGQPKCQIDETGTPRLEDGKYDRAADQYKTDRDALRDKASGSGDKGFFDGWRSFWFAPPVAAWVPFVLPSFLGAALGNVDACAVVEGVRSIMAYVWALAGLLLCVGMVTRTIRGGS